MFKGPNGRTNAIKIVAVIVICCAILIVIKLVTDNKLNDQSETEQATESVIVKNKLEIPEITETNEEFSIELNDGRALFTEEELEYAGQNGYFIDLSKLDSMNRAQAAQMGVYYDKIRSVERDNKLKDLEPSGWHTLGIYDKGHLLKWQLSNSDDIRNLITATEYFNRIEKPKYDEMIIEYAKENPGTHIFLRVTPYFEGDEQLSRGVLMEAYSIEDDGEFQLCEFIYNAQPGCAIDYSTGDYRQMEPLNEALGISREELAEIEETD